MPDFPETSRHKALVQLLGSFVETLWDNGYQTSDFCQALAHYAYKEAKHPEEKVTWLHLSLLFQVAAREAGMEGRELP
jgi:hypothetical protein